MYKPFIVSLLAFILWAIPATTVADDAETVNFTMERYTDPSPWADVQVVNVLKVNGEIAAYVSPGKRNTQYQGGFHLIRAVGHASISFGFIIKEDGLWVGYDMLAGPNDKRIGSPTSNHGEVAANLWNNYKARHARSRGDLNPPG